MRDTRRAACLTAAAAGAGRARVMRLNVTGIVVDGDNEGFYVARRYPPQRMNLALITTNFAHAGYLDVKAFAIYHLSHFQRRGRIQRQNVTIRAVSCTPCAST